MANSYSLPLKDPQAPYFISSTLRDEARRIAANIAKQPELLRRAGFHWVAETQSVADGTKSKTNLHILTNWQKQGENWKLLSRASTKL